MMRTKVSAAKCNKHRAHSLCFIMSYWNEIIQVEPIQETCDPYGSIKIESEYKALYFYREFHPDSGTLLRNLLSIMHEKWWEPSDFVRRELLLREV